MSILIGGQSFHHADADDLRIRVGRDDEHIGYGGDQVLVGAAPHLIDLVGGVGQHLVQPPELFAGGVVYHGAALQLLVEELSGGQAGVGAADGHAAALQRQCAVHGVHAGQRQQHGGLVDAGGGDLRLHSADVQGAEGGDERRIKAGGVHLHLAANAVGIDDRAHRNEFRPHTAPSLSENQKYHTSMPNRVKPSWKRSM